MHIWILLEHFLAVTLPNTDPGRTFSSLLEFYISSQTIISYFGHPSNMFPIKTIFKVQYNPIILKLLNSCLGNKNLILLLRNWLEKSGWICLTVTMDTLNKHNQTRCGHLWVHRGLWIKDILKNDMDPSHLAWGIDW